MSVEIASFSDAGGGAARAAYRLHRSLLQAGVESRMRVRIKKTDDWSVIGPSSKAQMLLSLLRNPIGRLIGQLQKSENLNPHSMNLLPSFWANDMNSSASAVLNLHWIAGETMSIADIGRIRKPVVWTLHDMWAFSGAEHVSGDEETQRWRHGYYPGNRPEKHRGIDIDRLVWKKKQLAFKTKFRLVAPSKWLASCCKASQLMGDWPITVIPNVLDTNIYKPLNKRYCREVLGLPADKIVLLFGAMGAIRDSNKGFDLLVEAVNRFSLGKRREDYVCVIFGQSMPQNPPNLPFPSHWPGILQDDISLSLLYNAADVTIVPSRIENLPQVCTEAQSCGCPVVAWNCAGFPDAIEHGITGYLATPYDPIDLAKGIEWVLCDSTRVATLSVAARLRATTQWAPNIVVPKYMEEFSTAIQARS